MIWLGPWLLDPVYWFLVLVVPPGTPWYWFDAAYYVTRESFTAALVFLLGTWCAVDWRRLFGRGVQKTDTVTVVSATLFCILASTALVYAMFWPLSVGFPDFVSRWLIDLPDVVYREGERFPIVANVVGLLSIAVFAPVVEEVLFRGLLLHRLTQVTGPGTAIVLSSLLFGVVHPDVGGAFLFSVVMSILYLRTQSLFIPIACHVLNNLVAWLWELGDMLYHGPDYSYSLADFQDGWPWGVGAGAIVLVWVTTYLFRRKEHAIWRLPLL